MSNLRVINNRAVLKLGVAEYVWVDAEDRLCSKIRTIQVAFDPEKEEDIPIIERWTAIVEDPGNPRRETTHVLHPCHYLPDPLRPAPSYIVLCEVRDTDDQCVPHNTRAPLRDLVPVENRLLAWWGFRQEYSLEPNDPIKMPQAFERHLRACVDSGLMVQGMAWGRLRYESHGSFKVGHRNMPAQIDPDPASILIVADHLWIARFLLKRIAWEQGQVLNFPIGTRLSVFFSTAEMRESPEGFDKAVARLESIPGDVLPDFHPRITASQQRSTHVEFGPFHAAADPYSMASTILGALVPGNPPE